MLSASVRSTASELLRAVLLPVSWSACESEVSTPALAALAISARARAADAREERWLDLAEPLAAACHGATCTWAGRLVPVSITAPPLSPSVVCDPPVPSAGWPPILSTAAWAPAFVRAAEAPVLEIPTRLLTWAAAAVAFPGGAGSAVAATGVKPMRRHAGAAAERIVRRMVLLSRGRRWPEV